LIVTGNIRYFGAVGDKINIVLPVEFVSKIGFI